MRPGLLFKHSFVSIVVLLVILFGATSAMSQTTSFTYQGRLTDSGTAANGNYDLQFALWDSNSGGAHIRAAANFSPVSLRRGVFSVQLGFGVSAFSCAGLFLAFCVEANGGRRF